MKSIKGDNLNVREELITRYKEGSIESFYTDLERVELLLSFIVPGKMVKDSAKELIERYKNLDTILKCDIHQLNIKGISNEKWYIFKLIGDLHKECFKRKFSNEPIVINCKSDVANYINQELFSYIKNEIGFEERESLLVLYLNSANHLLNHGELKERILFKGTLDRSAIYPREIAAKFIRENIKVHEETLNKVTNIVEKCGTIPERRAKKIIEESIKLKAKSVIIAHNHPSGSLKPSRSDIELTKNLKSILENLDIRLLDHVIVTRESYLSFLEEGLLE